MKLTPEQIQTVEKYLTNKDVEYIDLHLEVLDHISSDIETKMTEEAFSFSDAFEEGNKIGEYWWKAELYRLNGNLLLQQSQLNVMKAKDSFLKALNIARHQGSLMLELRAATSLYRLCQQQGMRGEESGSLADVYNRFTEGFDTYDLMNARGLIDEMQKDKNGNTNQSRH